MTDRTPTTRSDRLAAVAFVATVTLTLLFILGSLWPADAARYICPRPIPGHSSGCVAYPGTSPAPIKPPWNPYILPGHCPRPLPGYICGATPPPLKPQPPITWGGAVR